ncbi:MAG: FtsX-like permease family protein [Oscillospiraceae bacterium]
MNGFTFKNITRRRIQSLVTASITSVTIFVFVVLLCCFSAIQYGLKITANRLGADIIVLPEKGNQSAYTTLFTGDPQNVYMQEDLMSSLAEIDGIEIATPQFFTQTLEESCCSIGEEIRLVGYDKNSDFILSPWLESLDMSYPEESQIICGSTVPSFLGDITILLGHRFTIAGTLYETGSGMDHTMFIDINTAREIAAKSPYLKDYWLGRDTSTLISSVMIKTKVGFNPQEVADKINKLGLDMTATATDTVISSTRNQFQSVQKIVWALWLVILFLSVLALWGRFDGLVRDRRREIGLMRAMGTTKGEVFWIILSETWTLSAIGGLIGSIIGIFVAKPMVLYVQELMNLTVGQWSISKAILAAITGFFLSLLLELLSIVLYFKTAKTEQ